MITCHVSRSKINRIREGQYINRIEYVRIDIILKWSSVESYEQHKLSQQRPYEGEIRSRIHSYATKNSYVRHS